VGKRAISTAAAACDVFTLEMQRREHAWTEPGGVQEDR
jgi:hypothetical protein